MLYLCILENRGALQTHICRTKFKNTAEEKTSFHMIVSVALFKHQMQLINDCCLYLYGYVMFYGYCTLVVFYSYGHT